MKIRQKEQHVAALIRRLEEMGMKEERPLWTALAERLNRPRRKAYEVNLFRLDRYARAKETIVVPGTVLGSGELKKPVTVAALKFSGKAKEEIKKAGGKAMSIDEFIQSRPKFDQVRVMG